MQKRMCDHCGKEFECKEWDIERGRRFCSRKCYWASLGDLPRERFQKMRARSSGFHGPHSERTKRKISKALKGRKNPRLAEMSRNQRGPKHPRWAGPRLDKRRGRDQAERIYPPSPCERCGRTADEMPIHRHHKNGVTSDNGRKNIEFLCVSCHMKYHWAERRKHKE